MSQYFTGSGAAGPGGDITLTGDTGGSLSSNAFTIYANEATLNCGSSVSISGLGTALTLNVTDSGNNIVIGKGSGFTGLASSGGTFNVVLGEASLTNSAFGGIGNVVLGSKSATNYDLLESGNILVGYEVAGVAHESFVTRIGFSGGSSSQEKCLIDGIYGVSVSSAQTVGVTSSGQLGSISAINGVSIGQTTPENGAFLEVTGNTTSGPQLALTYGGSGGATFQVNSSSQLSISPAGSQTTFTGLVYESTEVVTSNCVQNSNSINTTLTSALVSAPCVIGQYAEINWSLNGSNVNWTSNATISNYTSGGYYGIQTAGANSDYLQWSVSSSLPTGVYMLEYQIGCDSASPLIDISFKGNGSASFTTIRSQFDSYSSNGNQAILRDFFTISTGSDPLVVQFLANGKNSSSASYTIHLAWARVTQLG